MGFFKTSSGFTGMQKGLHWIVAGLVAVQYMVFDEMGRPFRDLMEKGVRTYDATVVMHIAIGASVLLLTLWRLSVRLRKGTPPAPEGEPAWGRTASRISAALFYILLVLLPVSGSIAWFGMTGPAGGAHEFMTNLLIALVLVHVGAVIVHQYVWKTNVLREML